MHFSKEDTQAKVVQIISEKLSMPKENIKPEVTFKDLGADSLDIVEVIMNFEEIAFLRMIMLTGVTVLLGHVRLVRWNVQRTRSSIPEVMESDQGTIRYSLNCFWILIFVKNWGGVMCTVYTLH